MLSFLTVNPRLWIPTAKGRRAFWAAVIVLAVGTFFACSGSFFDAEGANLFYTFAVLQSCTVLPIVTVLFLIGSFRAEQAHPKFGLAAASALTCLLLIVMVALSGLVPPTDDTTRLANFQGALAVISCIFLPLFGGLVYLTIRAYGRAQVLLRENAAAELPDVMVQLEGEATYEQLSQALSIPQDMVDEVLIELAQNKTFVAHREPKFKRAYTTRQYQKRQRQLTQIVEARGSLYLDELQYELGVPRELLKEWMYRAVANKRFAGYVNWKEEKIYSADAIRLQEHDTCPNCHSKLTLGGKGVIHCEACGTDIFLTGDD